MAVLYTVQFRSLLRANASTPIKNLEACGIPLIIILYYIILYYIISTIQIRCTSDQTRDHNTENTAKHQVHKYFLKKAKPLVGKRPRTNVIRHTAGQLHLAAGLSHLPPYCRFLDGGLVQRLVTNDTLFGRRLVT